MKKDQKNRRKRKSGKSKIPVREKSVSGINKESMIKILLNLYQKGFSKEKVKLIYEGLQGISAHKNFNAYGTDSTVLEPCELCHQLVYKFREINYLRNAEFTRSEIVKIASELGVNSKTANRQVSEWWDKK